MKTEMNKSAPEKRTNFAAQLALGNVQSKFI